MAGNSLPLQMTGTENWATRSYAEVDGINSSRFHPDGSGHTLVVRPILSLIDDHEYPEHACALCRGPGAMSMGGMTVKAMTARQIAMRPFTWLA